MKCNFCGRNLPDAPVLIVDITRGSVDLPNDDKIKQHWNVEIKDFQGVRTAHFVEHSLRSSLVEKLNSIAEDVKSNLHFHWKEAA